jgi:hypothetical protein
MIEQKPVAHLWNDFGNLKVSQLEPHEDYAFPVFTAEQLKEEREKAIRDAASVAYGFHDCDAIAEEILALLSTNESKE